MVSMTTTKTFVDCPSPNDTLPDGRTVIASGWSTDEPVTIYGVLLLNKTSPYFTVAEIVLNEDGTKIAEVTDLFTEWNIVPATHCFHECFGLWSGEALTDLGDKANDLYS